MGNDLAWEAIKWGLAVLVWAAVVGIIAQVSGVVRIELDYWVMWWRRS